MGSEAGAHARRAASWPWRSPPGACSLPMRCSSRAAMVSRGRSGSGAGDCGDARARDEAVRVAFEVGNRHFALAIDGRAPAGPRRHRHEAAPLRGSGCPGSGPRRLHPARSRIGDTGRRRGAAESPAWTGRLMARDERLRACPPTSRSPLLAVSFADGLFPAGGFAHSFGLETYVRPGSCATRPGCRPSSRPTSREAPGPPTRWPWRALGGSLRAATSKRAVDLDRAPRRHAARCAELRAASRRWAGRRCASAATLDPDAASSRRLPAPSPTAVRPATTRGVRRRRSACRRGAAEAAAAAYLLHRGGAARRRGAAAPAARAGRGPARPGRRAPAHRPARCRGGATAHLDDLWAFTPGLEIAGLRHADLAARLFRS